MELNDGLIELRHKMKKRHGNLENHLYRLGARAGKIHDKKPEPPWWANADERKAYAQGFLRGRAGISRRTG